MRDLVSVHGARASVNTPPCRDVDFINVVTMAGLTTGNPKTLIMCRLHSNQWFPVPSPHTLSHTLPCSHLHPHTVSVQHLYLVLFAPVVVDRI